jgi:hypothetical protein
MIVGHPFTTSGIVQLQENGELTLINIVEDITAFYKWQKFICNCIDDCRNLNEIYLMVNPSYSLTFFDFISSELSNKDFSTLLGDIWTNSEFTNMNANVTNSKLLKFFKSTNNSDIMTESELDKFNSLDDKIIIYRGLTPFNKKNIKALSWTTSFNKAKWFANRFGDDGVVYSAIINKKDILAFFDRKNEAEVIVNYEKLENIKQVNKPISLPAIMDK